MNTIFVKPKGGARVRNPDSPTKAPLPPDGATVPRNSYWLRKLATNEVEEVKPQAAAPGPSAPADTAPEPDTSTRRRKE